MSLAGSAGAASPYDSAYGLQWNFMVGSTGADAGTMYADVTSDGTLFVTNRTGAAIWGAGEAGSVCGGVGSITPLGKVNFGTTLRSVPGMTNPNQNYVSGVSAVGNTAYMSFYANRNQYWAGQDTGDRVRVMTFSLNSSGLDSIADRHRVSKFKSDTGTLRTDGLGPVLPGGGLSQAGEQSSWDSVVNATTKDMIIAGYDKKDFAVAGDSPGVEYEPFVGRFNLDTRTLLGPQYQPVLKSWLRKSRSLPLPEIVATLKNKLRGVWNYYGVIGNSERNGRFAWFAQRLVYKWLNRRSQRRSYNLTAFLDAWRRWEIPMPRVVEKPWPQTRQAESSTI